MLDHAPGCIRFDTAINQEEPPIIPVSISIQPKINFFIKPPPNFRIYQIHRVLAFKNNFFSVVANKRKATPFALVNSQNKRASPAVDKCICLCLCVKQESESNKCFCSRIVWSLYPPVSLYIIIRSSGIHLVTKELKIIVVLSTSMCEKFSICNNFYHLTLLNVKNSNTVFYVSRETLALFSKSITSSNIN